MTRRISRGGGLLLQRLGHLRGFRRLLQFLNRRTFSIAMTAWSAKVFSELDLLVGEGLHLTLGA